MRALAPAICAALVVSSPGGRQHGAGTPDAAPAAVTGLDHVPVAVADLEAASARYRALGFTLKPGTPHANGIRNVHAKFADGTEIELITAPEARDKLTTTYRRHLEAGDGPAFVAVFAPDLALVVERLAGARLAYQRDRWFGDFPGGPLDYVFIGPRNRSPTDRPEHFVHTNTADALTAVWLAADDFAAERHLLTTLGATMERRPVRVPDPITADVARLEEGTVLFLPASRQVVRGRRIAGVTVRVRSVDVVRRTLLESGLPSPPPVVSDDGVSILLPPSGTHGLWLEFRQPR